MMKLLIAATLLSGVTSDLRAVFQKYSERWEKTHASWINLEWEQLSTCHGHYLLPVCVDGVSINGNGFSVCSRSTCFTEESHCPATPQDTFDYLPPSLSSRTCEPLSSNQPLPPYFGMEGGLPPEYSERRAVNLVVSGSIVGGDGCSPLSDVKIQFFHVVNDLFDGNLVEEEGDLREMSCQGAVASDAQGRFQLETTIPPSYGPPRHLNLMISTPGYRTLLTRVYFSQDIRLQQLSVGNAVVGGHETGGAFETSYHFPILQNSRPLLREVLSLEPRVCDLAFVDDATGGRLECRHDVVLQPDLPEFSSAELSGYWAESDGSLVRVETSGHFFFATQHPHLRTWGSISGIVHGNSIFGANFRNSDLVNNSQASSSLSEYKTVMSTSSTVGEVGPMDPFNSNDGAEIVWRGADRETTWHRSPKPEGYRYLKLEVTRVGTSPVDSSGSLIINEIEFYEGYLSQIEIPPKLAKLVSPRTPAPWRVLCSSFLDQPHHCFKAFDGDPSPGSAWISKPVATHRNEINSKAWITLDLGVGENNPSRDSDEGRRVRPSAMKIVCGAGNSYAGCPMTFALFGSNQPFADFELITSHDSFDFNASDFAEGQVFNFFEESLNGRAVGQRCGSCDRPLHFSCSLNAFDSSCETMYCGVGGLCAEPEACPPGRYLSWNFVGDGLAQFSCLNCPGGKFGNVSGLTSQFCSGECEAGCYCSAGAISSCEYQCGGPAVFCPKGSSKLLVAGAGMKTVDAFGESSPNSSALRVSVSSCSPGHYCQDGMEVACPPGVFGADSMLSSAACSGVCQPGYYCPTGTVFPLLCPIGSYCPDGIEKVQCPAGSYGATQGLTHRECSGPCLPGHYCPQGSSLATERVCPKGRYGAEFGLSSPLCSGPCEAGYYCPQGSTIAAPEECGSSSIYCPEGSFQPMAVTKGYYSAGGSASTRTHQLQCEKGFYCTERGEKQPCAIGSYGDAEGLFNTCSGFCEPGFFCPLNSTSPRSVPCPAGTYGSSSGLSSSSCSALCPVGHYCPEGSVSPVPCPAGIFGGEQGLRDRHCSPSCVSGICSDDAIEATICREGFYCPSGSTAPNQFECGGSEFFCPKGSSAPLSVDRGYFTTGGVAPTQRTAQEVCPLGHYCQNGTMIRCPPGVYGSSFGLSSAACSGPCPKGHYCPQGTVNGTTHRCPGGRYGNTTNLSDPACSGICAPGYFCPEASLSAFQLECGSYLGLDNSVYCLAGSSAPVQVPDGYYSLGGNRSTRTRAQQCGSGTYCSGGIVYDCPAGRYGASAGLSSPLCSGLCRSGYYCPVGSVRSNQVRCPRGRMGNKEGLTSAECAGPCQNPLECEDL